MEAYSFTEVTLQCTHDQMVASCEGEPWEQAALQSSYLRSKSNQEFLDRMLYKQPRRNSGHTTTITKAKKKELVLCQVCGQHRSRSPRTCMLCKRQRALPSCRPQCCWIQFAGKKQMGACKDCYMNHLHSKYPGPVASRIKDYLGAEYGAVQVKAKIPKELKKALNIMFRY